VTKEVKFNGGARPAEVFRLRRADYVGRGRGPFTLEFVGRIDVPAIIGSKSLGGLVTSMTVTSDAFRFALLTYESAIEFRIDLTEVTRTELKGMKLGSDFRVVPLVGLLQQEGLTYDENDRDLLYTSEVVLSFFSISRNASGRHSVPLMKAVCTP
jgi:hypothetical protein